MLNIWTIKGVLKYFRNCTWQMWTDVGFERPIITDCYGNTVIKQWLNITGHNNNTTSLTNHWQKAGPIHSLAWTPQSIHTAFFWWRLLFPIWQETSRIFRVLPQPACRFILACVSCSLSYLKHVKWPPLVRLPDGEHVDQVGLSSVHLKHPALDLEKGKWCRREKCYSRPCLQTKQGKRSWLI